MIFLIEPNQPWIVKQHSDTEFADFNTICRIKLTSKPKKFLGDGDIQCLLPILTEAYKYKYEEQPDYGKLRFMLEKILMERDHAPNTKLSWFIDRKSVKNIKMSVINYEEMNYKEDDLNIVADENPLPKYYNLRPKQRSSIFLRQPL